MTPWILALLPAALALNVPPRDVLMRVTMSRVDAPAMQAWLMQRPWAAVLPVQPMLVMPFADAPPPHGVTLTFRRKPSSEKGSTDGGIRFLVGTLPDEEESVLLVSRISEGQPYPKLFSERKLLRSLVAQLERLPTDVGAVSAVLDLTTAPSPDPEASGGP